MLKQEYLLASALSPPSLRVVHLEIISHYSIASRATSKVPIQASVQQNALQQVHALDSHWDL